MAYPCNESYIAKSIIPVDWSSLRESLIAEIIKLCISQMSWCRNEHLEALTLLVKGMQPMARNDSKSTLGAAETAPARARMAATPELTFMLASLLTKDVLQQLAEYK